MHKVIHIEGTDRTGKDTFRRHLVKESNGNYLVIVRSFISQVVYSRIYGRQIDEQWFVKQSLLMQNCGHVFTYLKVNLDIVKQRIIDTNEQDVNIEQIEYHTNVFDDVVEMFKGYGLNVITLYTTDQDLVRAKKNLEIQILKNEIQACTACSKHQHPINNCNIEKGYGKLIPDILNKNPYFMIVGMTPSSIRYPFKMHPFEVNDKGKNSQFREILSDLGILSNSVITNLVKCTTPNDSTYSYVASQCAHNIQKEIDLLKPTKLIALGNKTYKELIKNKIFNPENIIEIWHPAYCYSHHRITHEEYRKHIDDRLQ